ncbi:sensor histidine kinase [Rhizobium leguminosarum]|uniref:sensor histidine kinase n=1 Tax=Rhizobium leguminosarum TaxID=384 RepID=UPI001FDA8FC2|nr:histidine kinase dimerization/phosphoacceptor domain -containing protein [Rhizobium leguminosarum]
MRNVAASPDQTTIHFDYRILLPSGDVRHVTARGEVLRTSTGTVRTVGVLMDMTADRLPEAELAASVSNQKELLEQKDLLPAEVNHRVKNTLQLVVSTLHLQAWRLHFPVTVEAFEGAISRVRAIISVHERLYRSGNSLTVDMAGHLRKLCLDIVGETSAEKVTVEADALELPTERAIPVSIIVNELLSDVARHVFDRIYLSLKHKAEDLLELHVEINGRQSRPDELRIKIIATMAAQIGGTFEDGSATGGDYGATLTFPAREC